MGLESLDSLLTEYNTRSGEEGFDSAAFAGDFTNGLKGSGINKVQPEEPEDKGFIRETVGAVAGGTVDAAELWMRAVRTMDPEGGNDIVRDFATGGLNAIKNFTAKHPSLAPGAEVETGLKRWWVEGVRSFVPSLSAALPGVALGTGVAVATGGAGIPAAAAIGSTFGGAIFGLAEHDRFKEEVEDYIVNNQLDEEQAADLREKAASPAIYSAITEGGLEAAANALEVLSLRLFSPLKRTIKNVVKQPIKTLLKTTPGQVAKNFAQTAAIEVGTEMSQEALETKFRRDIGITDMSSWEAAMSVIGPSLVTTVLFAGLGGGTNALHRARIRKSLEDAKADPTKRKQAVYEIAETIRSTGQEDSEALADRIQASGDRFVDEGISIDLNTEIGIQDLLGEMVRSLQIGETSLAENRAYEQKLAEGLKDPELPTADRIKATQTLQGVKAINDAFEEQGIPAQEVKATTTRPATASEQLLDNAKRIDDPSKTDVIETVEEKGDVISVAVGGLSDLANEVKTGTSSVKPKIGGVNIEGAGDTTVGTELGGSDVTDVGLDQPGGSEDILQKLEEGTATNEEIQTLLEAETGEEGAVTADVKDLSNEELEQEREERRDLFPSQEEFLAEITADRIREIDTELAQRRNAEEEAATELLPNEQRGEGKGTGEAFKPTLAEEPAIETPVKTGASTAKPKVEEPAAEPEELSIKEGEITKSDRGLAAMSAEDFTALVEGTEVQSGETPKKAKNDLTKDRGATIPLPKKGGKSAPNIPKEKSPTEILAEIAKSGVQGTESVFKGLHELFGGSSLRSFPGAFDEDTWKKAKPLFESGWADYVRAGKGIGEFVQAMVNNYGAGIKPYIIKWGTDRQKKILEVPSEEEVAPEEPTKTGASTAKPKKKKGPKTKAAPDDQNLPVLKDFGRKLPAQKDEYIDVFKSSETGNAIKDANKIVALTKKPVLWPITLPEGASPGTVRYLEAIRDSFDSFTIWGGNEYGASRGTYGISHSEAIKNAAANDIALLRSRAAQYSETLALLREATKGSVSVQGAYDSIVSLMTNSQFNDDTARWLSDPNKDPFFKPKLDRLKYRSDEGKRINEIAPYKTTAIIKRISSYKENENEVIIKLVDVRRRPKNEEIDRTGLPDVRKGKHVTPEDFQKTFGISGVNYGNYINNKERVRQTDNLFDALHDLAGVLNIDLQSIGTENTEGLRLGLGFAASRKNPFSAAHYEAGAHKMDFTRDEGDGTSSHEWAHNLDWALGRTFGGQSKAVEDLVTALQIKFNIKRAEEIVQEMLTGNSVWNRRRVSPIETARKFLENGWRAQVEERTNFLKSAEALGGKMATKTEMFARGFEAYIYDTLKGSSPFLVTSWVDGKTATEEGGYTGKPYPTGEEREQFNRVYKHFIDGIEWTDTGKPTMKEDYEFVSEKEIKLAQEKFDKLIERLQEMFDALHQGDASKDGLWWYRYKTTKRAKFLQPKRISAYDDKFKSAEFDSGTETGRGAVAYTEPLAADDVLNFKLESITHDEDSNKIYLKEKSDGGDTGLDTAGLEGEAALGETQTEDGESTDTEGGLSGGTIRLPADGEEGFGASGGGRTAISSGVGKGDEGVDIPTGGEGHTELEAGPDAILGGGNYRITDGDGIGEGSINEKFTNNISAVRTLKEIESESRHATSQEQSILVKYVGWGGMSKAFDSVPDRGWEDKADILKDTLTDKEFEEARASTTDAFYTSPAPIRGIYRALEKFGFKGGKILEPAFGTGNFIGLVPESFTVSTHITGVEKDSISARIGRQLYQKSTVVLHNEFQEAKLSRNYYDLAISNVPFSEVKPFDRTFNKKRLVLHDYFFNKSLELVRPGGMVAFITSAGTMDKTSTTARKLFTEKADFVGAIRLPENTFKDSGTAVTTDIIFLRKKGGDGKKIADQKFLETADLGSGEADVDSLFESGGTASQVIPINKYFKNNPEMMLGKMTIGSGQFGRRVGKLISDGRDLSEAIDDAIKNLPEDIYTDTNVATETNIADLIPEEADLLDGSFTEIGGKLFINRPGQDMLEIPEGSAKEKIIGKKIRGFIGIRSAIRNVLKTQAKEEPLAVIKSAQKKLNEVYDKFVKSFGFLNLPKNSVEFIDEPEAARILALEKWDVLTETAEKADIFTKITIHNPVQVTSVDRAEDSIAHSLNRLGRIDIDFMAKLAGIEPGALISELKGQIYNDPESGWVIADEYLSGDIRKKIALAKQAAEVDDSYKGNVEALTPFIPEDEPPSRIHVTMGAPWIEPVDIQDFVREIIPTGGTRSFHIDYTVDTAQWDVVWKSYSDAQAKRDRSRAESSTAATATWGTGPGGRSGKGKNFFDLLGHILGGGTPVLKVKIPGANKEVLDQDATVAAMDKYEAILAEFQKWLWKDSKRQDKYVRKYNDIYNGIREREYNGDHLTFPGQVPDSILKLMPHQKAAIWRALSGNLNAYYAHEVGTGKTYAMVTTVMEAKRLGLKKKPMILAMNANVDAIAEDFIQLYPAARILRLNIAAKPEVKKIQLNKIALNDWDAVIINHDSFTNVRMSPEAQAEAFEDEVGNLRVSLDEAKKAGNSRKSIENLEKAIESVETMQKRLADPVQAALDDIETAEGKLHDGKRRSTESVKKIEKSVAKLREKQKQVADDFKKNANIMTFEELGVDMIVVDEAHQFKNLPYATKHTNVVGVKNTGASKARDLHMKTRWINEKFGGGIIFASGTPVTNSVAEIFNIQKYLSPDMLRSTGTHMFDAWAATFGIIGQEYEYAPEGGGFREVRKFKEFVNMGQLRKQFRSIVDVVTIDDLAKQNKGFKVPEMMGGKPIIVKVPQNAWVRELHLEMATRAKNIRGGQNPDHPRNFKKEKGEKTDESSKDQMVTVVNDGRSGAMDMRLINTLLPDDPDTKTNHAVPRIAHLWNTTKEFKGTQLVFADRGVPGNTFKDFNIHHDLKKKLVDRGIPENEIVVVKDLNKNKKKLRRLFQDVRSGKVRVVISNTADMGVGVNVQDRGVAIHNLDTDWHFGNLEQRRGRFVRMGNLLIPLDLPVSVFNYVTEGTVDAFMWDKVAAKKIITEQVLFGTAQRVEDISAEGMSAEETMAVASGDPRNQKLNVLRTEVRKLTGSKATFEDKKYGLRRKIQTIPGTIGAKKTGIEIRKERLKEVEDVNAVKIGDDIYILKKDSAELGKRVAGITSNKRNLNVFKTQPGFSQEVGVLGVATEIVEKEEGKKDKKVVEWKEDIKPVFMQMEGQEILSLSGTKTAKELEEALKKKKETIQDNLQLVVDPGGSAVGSKATGGFARLLAHMKTTLEKQIKDFQTEIDRLEEERDAINVELQEEWGKEELLESKEKELDQLKKDVAISAKNSAAAQGEGAVRLNLNPTKKQDDKVEEARNNIKDKLNLGGDSITLGLGVDPTVLKDLAVVGTHHFKTGLKSFSAWANTMLHEFGKGVKQYLRQVWRSVRRGGVETRPAEDRVAKFEEQALDLSSKEMKEEDLREDSDKVIEEVKGKSGDVFDQLSSYITQNPANVLNDKKAKAQLDNLFQGENDTDIGSIARNTNLPWWLAKKWKEWKQALGIELNREETRERTKRQLGERVFDRTEGKEEQHEFFALNNKSQERTFNVLLEGDARHVEFTNKELRQGINLTEMGKQDDDLKGQKITLEPEEIVAFRAWQVTMKKGRRMLTQMLEDIPYRPYKKKPWISDLKSLVRLKKGQDDYILLDSDIPAELDEKESGEFRKVFNKVFEPVRDINFLRRQMGELKGYVPHTRESGKYKVEVAIGQEKPWSEHVNSKGAARRLALKLTKKYEKRGLVKDKDFTVAARLTKTTPEFMYQETSAPALERFISKALDRKEIGEKLSEDDLVAVRDAMTSALTAELQERGFSRHMMKRKRGQTIGGYEIKNGSKVLAGYISGLTGFTTKIEAAFQFGELISSIDPGAKPKLYEDITIYSRNMLRNLTRADIISSRIRASAFVWYLSGQLKSPIVNITQNAILGVPTLAKFTKGARGIYFKAFRDVAFGKFSDEEAQAMKKANREGTTGDQFMQEVFGQALTHSGEALRKTIKVLSVPFSYSEIFNRKAAYLARFRAGIAKGETFETATGAARDFVFDVHFLFGKQNQPLAATSGSTFSNAIKTSLTFRTFSLNYLNALKYYTGEANLLLIGRSLAYMALLGGASALPFLDDWLDMIERMLGISIRSKVQKELQNAGGDLLAHAGIYGLPALIGSIPYTPFSGVDLSGSLKIHFPDPTDPGRLFEESVFGVYGGIAAKGVDAVKALTDGEGLRAFEFASPVFLEKPLKARRLYKEGAVTKTGKTIFGIDGRPLTATGKEIFTQALGFRPSRLASESGTFRQFTNIESFFRNRRTALFRRLRLADTNSERKSVLIAIREYNKEARKQKGAVPLITSNTLRRTQKEQPSKRFRQFTR
jgi:N12 class adenine-specific DNA methylase